MIPRPSLFLWKGGVDVSECFKSFTYDGKSTESVIETPLILATFDAVGSVVGLSRDVVKGGITITRPIPNEYGTTSNPATIEYCLIKQDFEPFSAEEQRTVEIWLTAPKFSTDLVIYDKDDQEVCTYCGLFTNTSWIPHSTGFSAVEFTFECNSAYPVKRYRKEYTVNSSGTITVNCESDELNEYIYPVLTISGRSGNSITITNLTDNGNAMTISGNGGSTMVFDCQHCIPTGTGGVISYSDLGWQDVGNIYWLRLIPGDNQIQVSGSATIGLEYSCPYKLVGGWL